MLTQTPVSATPICHIAEHLHLLLTPLKYEREQFLLMVTNGSYRMCPGSVCDKCVWILISKVSCQHKLVGSCQKTALAKSPRIESTHGCSLSGNIEWLKVILLVIWWQVNLFSSTCWSRWFPLRFPLLFSSSCLFLFASLHPGLPYCHYAPFQGEFMEICEENQSGGCALTWKEAVLSSDDGWSPIRR